MLSQSASPRTKTIVFTAYWTVSIAIIIIFPVASVYEYGTLAEKPA